MAARHVLSWRLSNTMDASFCIGALDDALTRTTPEILNTDSARSSPARTFADRVLGAGVAFSMDSRGRFLDNIFIERLWRSLKYEAVYLHELGDGVEAGRIIGSSIDSYNEVRPHSALPGARQPRATPTARGWCEQRITTAAGRRPRRQWDTGDPPIPRRRPPSPARREGNPTGERGSSWYPSFPLPQKDRTP